MVDNETMNNGPANEGCIDLTGYWHSQGPPCHVWRDRQKLWSAPLIQKLWASIQ